MKAREELPYQTEIAMPRPAMPRDRFREVMKQFPSAVSVVTAHDEHGEPRGLTCSAFASLSMDPPTMLVCVNRRNGSLAAIRASGGFVLNLLRAGRESVSQVFASGRPDKFDSLVWRPSPGSGLPWLAADSLAHVDCRVIAEVAAGSHAILIGLVTDGGRSDEEAGGPLVYWRHRYGCWQATATVRAEHGHHAS